MALFRCTAFFEYGKGGSSFSLLIDTASHEAASVRFDEVIKACMPLLGEGVLQTYSRTSSVQDKGDALVDATNRMVFAAGVSPPAGAEVYSPAIASGPDQWWSAALLRLGIPNGRAGRIFLRMIPDDLLLVPGRIGDKKGPWGKQLIKFFKAICAVNPFGMLTVLPSPEFLVDGFERAQLTDPVTVRTAENLGGGIIPGVQVRISGVKDPQGNKLVINGVWTVLAVTGAKTFTLFGSQGLPAFLLNRPGKYKLWSKTFVGFQEGLCQAIRATERKAGRPFAQLVGRRSKKKVV